MARPSRLAAPVTRTVLVIWSLNGRTAYAIASLGWPMLLVISGVGAHLAPEHPIRPAGIDQDHRQQEQGAHAQEYLGVGRRCRLPQRIMMRHDHGEQADR